MPSVIRVEFNGKDATAAYFDDDFNAVEPEQATLMKLIFDNGDTMWAEPMSFTRGKSAGSPADGH